MRDTCACAGCAAVRTPPRRAAELSDVVCGSSVPQSKIGMVLLAVFLLAVKSGNNPQSRDVFKKILEFDESIYLERNPDILEGVSKRYLASGWQHFFQNGKKEGRNGYTNTVAAYHAFITITEGDQPLKKFVEDFGNEGFGSVGANARLSSL